MASAFSESRDTCERCGSTHIREDVVDGALVLYLAECERCALRWTRALRPVPLRAATPTATAGHRRGTSPLAA